MTDRLRFNLHLPGLLKVLAEHLYTSKKVGIRELIQNAHDSCVRRKIEGNEPHYRPRIDLFADPAPPRLTIRRFLPIPIHVEDDPLPVNLGTPPWEEDDPDAAIREYI